MSKTLSVSGSYAVEAVNGNIDLTAQVITIDGNLVVKGSTTELESINSTITDNIIELNNGEQGTGVSAIYAGISIDRGLADPALLRWNETTDRWEVGIAGSMSEIVTLGAGSVFLTHVEDDPAPRLGGNLNVSSYIINSDANTDIALVPGNNGTVVVGSPLTLNHATVTAADPNTTVVYAGPVAGGGSGVYAATTDNNDELVSRKRAIAYALIF